MAVKKSKLVKRVLKNKEGMTDKEYLEYKGNKCPYCESRDISALTYFSGEGINGFNKIHCNKCKRYWTDIFELIGYMEAD